MRDSKKTPIGLALACLFLGQAAAGEHRLWPGGFVSRVELLALMQTLNANLLASTSATATLEQWCADHHMAPDPHIVARRVDNEEKAPSDETRTRLKAGSGEPIKYRRVQLACGDHVLSEADNWYVPSRLPEDANRALETTDTPFGKAVRSLQPYRRTIATKALWSPLPRGWELEAGQSQTSSATPPAIPRSIFEIRAILLSGAGEAFSEVHETYTNEIFDFGAGQPVER